jgi:hypothetical protein
MRWVVVAALTIGCAHRRGSDIATTLIATAVMAIEVSTEDPPPPVTYCDDDSNDPPHVCPGMAPSPPDQ